MTKKDDLIRAIIPEIERIFGGNFEGNADEYTWLLAHYGVEEEDDVYWFNILEHAAGDFPPEDYDPADTEEWLQFLNDDQAVCSFLEELLQKYRSNTAVYTA